MAKRGSRVLLRGTDLLDVVAVGFVGSPLEGDEVATKPISTREGRLAVKVPKRAATGPLVVQNELGQYSQPSPELQILTAKAPKRTDGPIATRVTGRKTFVDGPRRPTLSYRLQTDTPAQVTVAVVSQATSTVVDSFDEGTVAPGTTGAVAWRTTKAAEGRYTFVVSAAAQGGTTATTAQSAADDAFVVLGHKFPIRGKHSFGSGAGRFGAGRTGHSHQGQDVFAKCGTPLVAARGGTVKMRKYQGNAGNYLVIDNAGEGTDTMYAHLRDPALVTKGDRVHTGDPIGYVGDTGDAQGCHLHFEEWSAPGWYTGGSPFDPLPDLRAWDELS
jgi:hypothetical protein